MVWENSTNQTVLEWPRDEIRKSCGNDVPPVYDPFSCGCLIPLNAQRLGLPAYGSDLNPVAVMIDKGDEPENAIRATRNRLETPLA